MSLQPGLLGPLQKPAPPTQLELLPAVLKAATEGWKLCQMHLTEVKLESKKKEIESYKIYFSKHSADIVYQYKYIKTKELDIQNEKLRLLATRDKVLIEPSELGSKVRSKIYKEILQSTMPDQSLLTERTNLQPPSEKETSNTLICFLPKINYLTKPAQLFVLDLFQPNRQAFEAWRKGPAFGEAHGQGKPKEEGEAPKQPPAPLWSKPPQPVFYEGTLVITQTDGA